MTTDDFIRLNAVFDQVEGCFKKLAQQEKLAEPFIERWRWDNPSIYIRWNDIDTIQKNITAYIEPAVSDERLLFEVNAWRDSDKDNLRTRRWKHDDTGYLVLPVTDHQVWNKTYNSYTYVSDWSEDMLTQVANAPLVHP